MNLHETRRVQARAVARCVWAAVAGLLLILSACSARPAGTPEDVVEHLYEILLTNRVSGAPTAEQLAELAPYISDTLRVLLADARRLHDDEVRAFPDEKPAFAEGDLFSSLFEGPSRFRIVGREAGPPYRVQVGFTDDRADPPVTWTDVAVVMQEQGRWVVDDVVYQGQWDFASRGTLRSGLTQALAP